MNNMKMGFRDFIISPFLSPTGRRWLLCMGTSRVGEYTQKAQ